MMNQQGIWAPAIVLVAVLGFFQACSPSHGDNPGHEYMPDMAHAIAYEANTYGDYYYNNWDKASQETQNSGFSRKQLTLHNLPAEGTVPRGYLGANRANTVSERFAMMRDMAGENSINAIHIPVNGSVPYYIPNTEEGRQYAYTAAEMRMNPFPISEKGLEQGKELYEIYCGICHGNKGDGNGWLIDEANKNSKYPAQPSNYLNDEFTASENGRYYHAIMYGKGVMGSYKDKLSYEERWNVIHYIRSLQAKKQKLTYNQYENTFQPAWGIPFADTDASVDLSKSHLAKEVKKEIATPALSNRTFLLENVFFETGSAALKAKSKMELNELAAILDKYETTIIELAGHTDNTGAYEGNLALSDARANSVKEYLVSKGVDEERLQAKGYGQDKPVATNLTETGRAKNRRTEFLILSK